MNNLNDLFSHKIFCSINVQYNVYIFLQLYILGAVNSTFFLKVGLYPRCNQYFVSFHPVGILVL